MLLTRLSSPIRYSMLILSLALIVLTMKADHGGTRASAAANPNEPMPKLQGQPVIDPNWSLTGNLSIATGLYTNQNPEP